VLEGDIVQSTVRTFVEQETKKGRRAKGVATIAIKVTCTSADTDMQEGELNQNGFSFNSFPNDAAFIKSKKSPLAICLMVWQMGGNHTVGCALRNDSKATYENASMVFVAKRASPGPHNENNDVIHLAMNSIDPFKPGDIRQFLVPFEEFNLLRNIVEAVEPENCGLVLDSGGKPLGGFRGSDVDLKGAVKFVDEQRNKGKKHTGPESP
jgi:hypothetical protein